MYKMTILFRHPPDAAKFENDWSNSFVPVAEAMPGIRRVAVSHVMGGPTGSAPYYKLHEFFFDDRDALDHALTSEKGVRAGQALMAIAGNLATILFADVLEEDRDPLPSIAPPQSAAKPDNPPESP